VEFLKIRLKEDFELKPQSKAIPNNEYFLASPASILHLTALTRKPFMKS